MEIDDEDSTASVESFLGKSKDDIAHALSRGKSFNTEVSVASGMEMLYYMESADIREEEGSFSTSVLNNALGNGSDDFDFRNLSPAELKTLLRGDTTREAFSIAGKMARKSLLAQERAEKKRLVKNNQIQNTITESLNVSVEYSSLANTSSLKVAQNSLPAQDAYLDLIKFVFLRESSLIKISDIVQTLDRLYWMYANVFIARKQYFKTSDSNEELRGLQESILSKQEVLAVALAHHRSISVSIAEGVQLWRQLLQKDVQMTEVASLFWCGQNYLIKMLHDTTKLFDTQTMRMWLGFEVDCFIIPPSRLNPHEERLNRERKLQQWRKMRDDHNMAALKKLMSQQVMYRGASMVDRESVSRQASMQHAQQLGAMRGGGGKERSMSRATSSSQSTPALPPISSAQPPPADLTQSTGALSTLPEQQQQQQQQQRDNSVCLLAPRRRRTTAAEDGAELDSSARKDEEGALAEEVREEDEEDASSMDSSTVTSLFTDDTGSAWRVLRDSCWPSWNYLRALTSEKDNDDPFDQESEEEGDFWKDLDLNEHQVEAAAGYLFLYPRCYLVPPMKRSLVARCRASEQMLLDEVTLADRARERNATSQELRVELDRERLQEHLAAFDSEEAQLAGIEDMTRLQGRQQAMHVRDHRRQQEISREYVAALLDSRKPYQRYISSARAMSSGRELLPSRSSPRRSGTLPPTPKKTNTSDMFAVFLTAPCSNDMEVTRSTVSFIPENVICTMNPTVLKERMAAVVENDRQAVIRVGHSLILRSEVHRGNRVRAYQNKPTKKINAMDAIVFMQSMVRGVLTRARLARQRSVYTKFSATLFLQGCLRRYVRRCRERVKRRIFKADCLRVRREILLAHRSSDIIVTFFKYLIFLRHRRYFSNKYEAISRLDVPRMAKVLRATGQVQCLFRGFSCRRWFHNILLESRKRVKLGPKYCGRVVEASRARRAVHHFTVAGSGGFKYWWRHSPEKNSIAATQAPTILVSDRKVVEIFKTGGYARNEHGVSEELVDKGETGGQLTVICSTPTARERELARRQQEEEAARALVGMVSEESVSMCDTPLSLSLHLPSPNTPTCAQDQDDLLRQTSTSRSLELKKRSNIRGRIAMLKGGSRSHYKGVNLLRAVPVKDREFEFHRAAGGGISVGGGSTMSTLDGAHSHSHSSGPPRSHTVAYENPNVHFKARQEREGGLGSLYGSLDSKRTSELKGLLQDVYGFQK